MESPVQISWKLKNAIWGLETQMATQITMLVQQLAKSQIKTSGDAQRFLMETADGPLSVSGCVEIRLLTGEKKMVYMRMITLDSALILLWVNLKNVTLAVGNGNTKTKMVTMQRTMQLSTQIRRQTPPCFLAARTIVQLKQASSVLRMNTMQLQTAETTQPGL